MTPTPPPSLWTRSRAWNTTSSSPSPSGISNSASRGSPRPKVTSVVLEMQCVSDGSKRSVLLRFVGLTGVKLEELLVEETWLDAIPGELQKPYALTLSKFVESEISSGDDVVYPPTHLIFNALNSTPFDRVKAVILGQVRPFLLGFSLIICCL